MYLQKLKLRSKSFVTIIKRALRQISSGFERNSIRFPTFVSTPASIYRNDDNSTREGRDVT